MFITGAGEVEWIHRCGYFTSLLKSIQDSGKYRDFKVVRYE